MEEIELITLEDNKNYYITDEIKLGNETYIYLASEEDIANICVRKNKIINNEEYIVGLDSEEELKKALKAFYDKHH